MISLFRLLGVRFGPEPAQLEGLENSKGPNRGWRNHGTTCSYPEPMDHLETGKEIPWKLRESVPH